MIQTPSAEEVRQITAAVLDRPEFEDSSVSIWERMFSWLFRALPEWSLAHPELARLLMLVLTLVLVLLLAHIAYTVIREFASYRREPASQGAYGRSLEPLEDVGAQNWSEALAMAKAALADRDLYRALWITHRILLSVLDRMDALRFARWKTNRDYMIECEVGGAAAGTLAEVTAAYERVVYAHQKLSQTEAARLLSEVELLAKDAEP